MRTRLNRLATTIAVLTASTVVFAPSATAQVESSPSNAGLPGAGLAQTLLNWASWVGLVGSLLAVLVGGAVWCLSQQAGNTMAAGRGRSLVTGGAVGAFMVGVGPTMINALFTGATA